jgi:hypothetical protein
MEEDGGLAGQRHGSLMAWLENTFLKNHKNEVSHVLSDRRQEDLCY